MEILNWPTATTWILRNCWSVWPEASVTWVVNENVPDNIGVPEMAPLLELSVRPVGSAPELRFQL